jgi:DNA-binding NarL/FixJ family response regulator
MGVTIDDATRVDGPCGLPAPRGLEAWRLEAGGQEFALLELPAPPDGTAAARRLIVGAAGAHAPLSGAEADVLRAILEGRSNGDIARSRGTTARTVANQVASIFRKLGVRSRLELCAVAVSAARGGA